MTQIQHLRTPRSQILWAFFCIFAAFAVHRVAADYSTFSPFFAEAEDSESVQQGISTLLDIDRPDESGLFIESIEVPTLVSSPHLVEIFKVADAISRKSHRQRGPPVVCQNRL